ncbi:hypothetical protein [Gloeothece verrucosa]|uniref:Uncharacterized protein n=1 Tax=Gloeothece verrucosa (strain PCC 7822) TaxID=497965 RepID=E0U7W0_GLOV7|nr:hypothetical protein [Gloeothece verrucosa]ADN16047.1 hypothetical protein Cyan7822_4127 [Gloeothece verrucosa PCC 7822]
MNLQQMMSLNKQKSFDYLLVETQKEPVRDDFYNSSWDNPMSLNLNYWILLIIPTLLIMAFFIEAKKKFFSPQNQDLENFADCSCQRCKYFSPNPYLKCAVNPKLALTKESCDCPSFNPDKN